MTILSETSNKCEKGICVSYLNLLQIMFVSKLDANYVCKILNRRSETIAWLNKAASYLSEDEG